MSDFDDEVDKRMREGEDMGLNISSLTLPELMMLSAQTGPVLMLPSVTGDPADPIGFGFIIANVAPELVFDLRRAVEAVLDEHGVVERDPNKAIVSVERPYGGPSDDA